MVVTNKVEENQRKTFVNSNLVPRAFPLKNGWGATHFLREKPWARGCVNSWVRCLENNQLVITSGFPTVNFRKMREIQILNILSLFMAMKEHVRYKADTTPPRSRTQNISLRFLISISAVILKLMLGCGTRGAARGDIFARHLAAHQRIWN